jgi:hypothetical protein
MDFGDIDVVEVGFGAVIAIAIAFIIYELLQALSNQSGPLGQAASAITKPVTTAEQTLLGGTSTGQNGTDSNLFYSGIENFFTTGSLTGDTSSD